MTEKIIKKNGKIYRIKERIDEEELRSAYLIERKMILEKEKQKMELRIQKLETLIQKVKEMEQSNHGNA